MRIACSFHHAAGAALALILACQAGCGILTFQRTDFDDELVGAEGQDIVLDQINDILNDAALDTDEKRQALRDLGIEDEDLLDAILAGA